MNPSASLYLQFRVRIFLSIVISAGLIGAVQAATRQAQTPPSRVLFIDLNNAPAEVAAVRGSIGRLAQIDVWPTQEEISKVDRQKVYEIGIKAAQVQSTLTRQATLCSRHPNAPSCLRAWQQLRSLEIERQRLTQNISLDSLRKMLSNQHVRYTTTVVSGHHENGFFEGELARLNIEDLQSLVRSYDDQFESVRSVLLLGCDTAADRLMQARIRPIFPSAKVIIGAEGPAPTRNEARNLRFIKRVFKLEPQLIATKQESFIRSSVAQLRTEIWPVAILWGDVYSAGTDTEHITPLIQLIRTSNHRLRR